MHVLFIPSWYPADPDDPFGSFFREQALAMKQAGATVGIIAPRLVSLAQPIKSLKVSGRIQCGLDEGLPTYRQAILNTTPKLWRVNARRVAGVGYKLFRAYCFEHGLPDIVHVQSTIMCGAVAQKIKKDHGVPFVVSEHSSSYARGFMPSVGKEIVRDVSAQASGTFAVSAAFCRVLEEVLDLPVGSYNHIPNMVDQAFLSQPLPAGSAHKKNLLHVSMLDKNKNVQLILKAFHEAFGKNTDVKLTIVGDGPERPSLQALVQHLGINRHVRFTGRLSRSQVRYEMSNAGAFLLSSNYETFGVVLIEALAMGLPLIATRCGGPNDIVRGKRGMLVPKNDVKAYAHALRCVVGSLDTYNPHDLRASCAAEFGPDVISEKWLKVYRQVTKMTKEH